VEEERSRIRLTIQDDGQGFQPDSERGMGLLGMQERVTHLGGTIQVDSARGQGTLLSVELPLQQNLVS
jgi:signal transduction histidine kinase